MHHFKNTALARVCQTLRVGDIIFFSASGTTSGINHVGIYAGGRLYTQVHTEQAYATAKSASFQIADVRFAQ